MNCYDFDKTIYDGDSSCQFYLFSLRRHPKVLRHLPAQAMAFFRFYLLHRIDKTAMKEIFYRYFQDIPNISEEMNLFWARHLKRIKPFYIEKKKEDDVIISASPLFFLKPACDKLGICHLIASPVDPATGRYEGKNCHGEEKVRRFFQVFPEGTVDDFYSDSHSDDPMAKIAKQAYWVRKNKISQWIL